MSKSGKSAYFRHIFAYNFFRYIISKLFQQIWNQRNTLHFFIPIIEFLKKKNVSKFCMQMHTRWLKKTEKLFK
jgi:hypothetical protein